jgi:putative DNA primase/helicase
MAYDDDVTTRVTGRWPSVLKELGIDEKFLRNQHGSCPLCGGTDRYRFDDIDGRGTYFCQGCGAGNGWTLVQKYFGVNFAKAAEMIVPLVGLLSSSLETVEPVAKRDPVPALKFVASKSEPIRYMGSVSRYLQSRGFDDVPEGLRQANLNFYKEGRVQGQYEVLLALVQDFEGNGVSYHLTYTEDGEKANITPSRKVMSPKGTITGAAIRLHVDFEDKICVAEGIESAYAAHKDSGFPAFATISAHGMESFVAPKGVKTVWVYGDNDESYTGQAAAYALAKRLRNSGIEAWVFIPDRVGDDFNDVLMKKER